MSRKPRPVTVTVRVLGGRHELALRGVTRQDDSFRIGYTITPPLPDDAEGGTVLPVFEAEDDLGNEYSDWGGAYGTSDDGSHTSGTLTAQPALPEGARSVAIRVTFLRGGEEYSYEVALDVPPAAPQRAKRVSPGP
ncbi:hypothetical protein [Streptomyces sp. WAC 06725]|uniref:hypothetical protein n=1 Tax=Streptomyces sp. WAC 06725 TaxID=2203209 RepID=UPI0021ADF867|nr:hypothetical protein [Streptomyces sp. WAC 06725]